MPEKHDLLAAILAAKEQGIGAIPCVCNGVPSRQIYNGGAFTKTVIEHESDVLKLSRTDFIRDLLDFAGLSSNLAYA